MTPAAGTARTATDPGTRALAVIVSAGVTPYLGRTLRAVACLSRTPDVVLVVDVASRTNGLGDGTPVEDAVDLSGLDAVSDVRIVRAPEAPTFLAAVRAGLARYGELVAAGNRRRPAGRTSSSLTGSGSLAVTRSTSSLATGRSRALTDALGEDTSLTGPEGARSPITRAEAAAADHDEWLWLLHDDSAPAPQCLAELLSAVEGARSVALAGPKQVGWEDPGTLLEVGLRTTASARRANDILEGEVDQGQHDDRSDVLAVGTAGALVSRSAWEAVSASGVTADVDAFGDSLALSRCLRLQGHRVIVVPTARLSHRRAAYLGLRGPGAPARPPRRPRGLPSAPPTEEAQPDTDRSFRARRAAQLRSWATASPAPLPLLLAWFCVLAGTRACWRLVAGSPALARDELAAAARCLRVARRVRRDRRRLAALTSVRRDVIAQLYVPASEIRATRRDLRRQERERQARAAAPSELEVRELAALARRRRRALGAALLVVTAVALAGTSGVLTTRAVTGGALAGLGGWQETWRAAWSTWAASGDGYPSGASPFLAVLVLPLLVGSWLGLDGGALIHLLLVLALPLAALGAWSAAGTITRRTSLRAWAALAWSLAPALLLGVGQGRLGPVLVHLTLPWALTALSRALGADRRDVVLSGLVGAHHLSEQDRADLDRFAGQGVACPAGLADDQEPGAGSPGKDDASLPGSAGAAGRGSDHLDALVGASFEDAFDPTGHEPRRGPVDDDPATPVIDDVRGIIVSARTAHGAAVRAAATEQYGPGSASAAAAAGLLLSVVVAVAPSTSLLLLPGLVLLALLSRRARARVLLTLTPVAATAAPLVWRAWEQAAGLPDGWREALRYLLTDVGAPLAVPGPSGAALLLGSPVRLTALVEALAGSAPLPAASTALGPGGALVSLTVVIVAALLAFLPLYALLGAVTRGARGRRARAGLLVAAGGLALALAASRTVTGIGTEVDGSGSVLTSSWAGTGLSLMTAGLLASALAGADAARSALVRHAFGWRHSVLAVLGVVAVLVPLLIGGSWAVAAQQASSAGRADLVMALAPSSRQVPVIAAEIASSDTAGRVLVLTSTDEGMRVRLWHGDGTSYTDTAPDVLLTQLRTRAEGWQPLGLPLAPVEDRAGALVAATLLDPADADLADVVVRAVTGQDEHAADDLAAHGVAVVLLSDRHGDEPTAAARAGLDATPGLEPLAVTRTGTSWRVSPSSSTQSSAVYLRAADGRREVIASAAGAVRTRLGAAEAGRTLVLAERKDPAWTATLDGVPLAPAEGAGWNQAFTVPAGARGELVVEHAAGPARPVLMAVWALTALAALPVRRRRYPA
ncbi:glycosyltransferase [Actinomyces sp. W5033]|uniref:glycosyltransferase n=1 Tax=Actinomyces sp. W5033 TaxID=3446479 RepID=UPI003EDE81C5